MELPPRTRRILSWRRTVGDHEGTTSAHAENTFEHAFGGQGGWNYLRARGEYLKALEGKPHRSELPPRTRRILKNNVITSPINGTTSAHAENTWVGSNAGRAARNYLRARGEYITCVGDEECTMELPPRTRRIRAHKRTANSPQGTTSAHAENTLS